MRVLPLATSSMAGPLGPAKANARTRSYHPVMKTIPESIGVIQLLGPEDARHWAETLFAISGRLLGMSVGKVSA
jgi:hypothetical protein